MEQSDGISKFSWNAIFQNRISSVDFFIFNGKIIDKATLGNMTYAYLGRAVGFPEVILCYGGGWAASKWDCWMLPNYGDMPEDIEAIQNGADWFDSRNPFWIRVFQYLNQSKRMRCSLE